MENYSAMIRNTFELCSIRDGQVFFETCLKNAFPTFNFRRLELIRIICIWRAEAGTTSLRFRKQSWRVSRSGKFTATALPWAKPRTSMYTSTISVWVLSNT